MTKRTTTRRLATGKHGPLVWKKDVRRKGSRYVGYHKVKLARGGSAFAPFLTIAGNEERNTRRAFFSAQAAWEYADRVHARYWQGLWQVQDSKIAAADVYDMYGPPPGVARLGWRFQKWLRHARIWVGAKISGVR